MLFSSPFSGTFFQSSDGLLPSNRLLACVFVPFLGDFFSMPMNSMKMKIHSFRFRPLFRGLFSIRKRKTNGIGQSCFRPLSWGLSFNIGEHDGVTYYKAFPSPFLGTFFQFRLHRKHRKSNQVSVPFLGDFLSIQRQSRWDGISRQFPSPFLGTFFQWENKMDVWKLANHKFPSPFLGTFFQLALTVKEKTYFITVSVPFLGDFLSILDSIGYDDVAERFRPLSWGLSFNMKAIKSLSHSQGFVSVPFLGDFLSIGVIMNESLPSLRMFPSPFLGTFFQLQE